MTSMAVGLIGLLDARTLGVGYSNITDTLAGKSAGFALLAFMILKFISWNIALGSGTSGGTLAPLLTIGSSMGYLMTAQAGATWHSLNLDPRLGALAGMAALFSGCSGAVMASLVFAFEATHQVPGVLPLLLASLTATATAKWLHPHNIMTEKLHRRGVKVPHSWGAPIH